MHKFNLNEEEWERIKSLPYLTKKEIKYILSLNSAEAHEEMQHLKTRIDLLLLSCKYKGIMAYLKKEKE